MDFISSPSPWLGIFFGIFIYAMRSRDKKLLWGLLFCGVTLALTDIISFELVKPLFARERPCWVLKDVSILAAHCGGSYGLTSNHAANAAAAATVIWLRLPAIFRWFAVPAVFIIGYSRVYLGVHYPGDIIAGYLLGICLALGLEKILFQYFEKKFRLNSI